MIAVVWEFVVRYDALDAFRQAYGPEGDWAALFRRHPGFAGTTLLQDTDRPTRFITIDRWENAGSLERMRAAAAEEYARMDARFATLTVSEREIGTFHDLGK